MSEPSLENVGWRLTELEKRVDVGFHDVREDIRSLQYVSREVYVSERAALTAAIEAANMTAARAQTIAMWTIGLLVTFMAVVLALAAKVATL